MVCGKCQKLNKTTLATPGVKKKSEMYYGSPAASSSSVDKKSVTLGQTGISKVSNALIFLFQGVCLTDAVRRASCFPRPPRTPTRSTRAPADGARPRSPRGTPTAINVPTAQTVSFTYVFRRVRMRRADLSASQHATSAASPTRQSRPCPRLTARSAPSSERVRDGV